MSADRVERASVGGFGVEDRIAETRSDVVRVAKQMSRLGLVVSVWGNVSARVRETGRS
jgi:ribulose-5-phosphate 4-epimerase/fuculose-1-phosphate aldolase